MEKITYLVANYNNGKYIEECIDSLKNQTSEHWFCVICDDASTDNSIQRITPHLGEQIKLIRNEQNQGYVRTLKKLIEHAETDIVAILDSDDALYLKATEEVINVYRQDKNIEFVYTRSLGLNENLTQVICQHGDKVPEGKTSMEFGYVSHLRTFRKRAYYRTEGWDETMLYSEDMDLIYKLEEVTFPVFINQFLHKYRFLENSQSHDKTKGIISAKNHVKAQKKALNRRKIKGFDKFIYLAIIYINHIAHNHYRYPWPIGRLAHHLKMFLIYTIDYKLNIRSGGQLRRNSNTS